MRGDRRIINHGKLAKLFLRLFFAGVSGIVQEGLEYVYVRPHLFLTSQIKDAL